MSIIDVLGLRRPDPLCLTARERALMAGQSQNGAGTGLAIATADAAVLGLPSADGSDRAGAVYPRPSHWRRWDSALSSARLVSYRFDTDAPFRERLRAASERWLATALAADGRAQLVLETVSGEAHVRYSAPHTLGALVPDARFADEGAPARPAVDLHGRFHCAAAVVGEPADGLLDAGSPWDALLAPGALSDDVRVTVTAEALPGDPGEWIAQQAATISARLGYLERYDRTRVSGGDSRRIVEPWVAAQRDALQGARRRLLDGGERARLLVTVEAVEAADLDLVCSLLTGCMERASAGSLAAPASCMHLPAIEDGMLMVSVPGSATELAPTAPAVPIARIAALVQPPTVTTRGLSVVEPRPDVRSAQPFAAAGFSTAGEVRLGVSATGAARDLTLADFCQHLVVTGATGMGKTRFTSSIARQLIAAGVRVAVLEPAKPEYAELIGDLPGVRALGGAGAAERLRINPFAVDGGVAPFLWQQDLESCLISAYRMEEGPLLLRLHELVDLVYSNAGIDMDAPARGNEAWPTAADLRDTVPGYVQRRVNAAGDVAANTRAALELRARTLAATSAFAASRGLMTRDLLLRSTVIRLNDLGGEGGAFAGMVILARLLRGAWAGARAGGGGPRRPRLVVILEEAHALLRDRRTGQPTMFSRLYEDALAELRAAGIGLITVEQRPSLLPDGVLANSVTHVHFASRQQADREAVAQALGLSEYQRDRLSTLSRGEAVMATVGSQQAELIRIGGMA